MTTGIFDRETCYLTPKANLAVSELVEMGFDRDLAFSFLENLLGEAMFELPEETQLGNVAK